MVSFTCIFVSFTLIFTVLASVFITWSLLSNDWEFAIYNKDKIEQLAEAKNHTLEPIGERLIKLKINSVGWSRVNTSEENASDVVYLVPAHGGVNALCMSEEDHKQMESDGFVFERCISYLSNDGILSKDAWLDRMRNLAMSCAIVSLILLGSSAPLGLLGLLKKQISTIMVTGVMYTLAAVFGIFTLAFMHFKRVKPNGYYTSTLLDKNVPEEYLSAREFTVGWPVSMGWAGISLCLIASTLWLLLAKIMRFQVLSPT